MKPRTIRLDDSLWEAAEEEASARGLSSAAEYIRQATVAQIAWDRAMAAIRRGGNPDDLNDMVLLARVLDKIADEKRT